MLEFERAGQLTIPPIRVVYFKLYDQDNSGGISKDELYKMVKLAWGNAFRTLAATHADKANLAMDLLDHMVDDLAMDFSGQVFRLLDTNKDGVLSLDEFKSALKRVFGFETKLTQP